MKAIIFGEVIWDIYPHKQTIGGAPFNFGANLSIMGNEVYLITGIGNDSLGKQALEEMKKYSVRTDFVTENNYATGRCTVTLDDNKIPSYHVHENTAYDNIDISDAMIDNINKINGDVFYFNSLIQRNETSAKSLLKILQNCSFGEIFCDINIREGCYSQKSLLTCMTYADTIKISDEELHYLYDTNVLDANCTSLKDICNAYPNIKTIVYTKGAKGSEVYNAVTDKTCRMTDVPAVEVASTVGAGDCYGATYLDSICKGYSIDTAIRNATEQSAKVVASYEAIVR